MNGREGIRAGSRMLYLPHSFLVLTAPLLKCGLQKLKQTLSSQANISPFHLHNLIRTNAKKTNIVERVSVRPENHQSLGI